MSLWQFREHQQAPQNLAKALSVSPLFLQILLGRGLGGQAEIESYLAARKQSLVPPAQWPTIPQAAAVLSSELLKGKKLAVWGDYDVDGITATALVLEILEAHGISALHHLPDRKTEGYGLNIAGVEKLAKAGCEILLTVDCGISDTIAIARANELGMTVIVSDHHLPGKELPPAAAICDPRLGVAWPCPHLAGVGVAFYLMAAVNQQLSAATGKKYKMDDGLDLVALGTLADIVRLEGQNRILARAGLARLAGQPRPGIASLKTMCSIDGAAEISGTEVVFRLAPRINAAGRMSHAELALRLLRSRDYSEARELAQQLEHCNTARKKEENHIHREAKKQARELLAQKNYSALVLFGADWHAGIAGIVASRIVDEFHRPTIILCEDGGKIKGSGRATENFDLFAALQQTAECLCAFGGHRQAAGVRLEKDNLEKFREAFDAAATDFFGSEKGDQGLLLDGELDFAQASNQNFLRELDLMQPFGPGNEEPVFASPPLRVVNRSYLGHSGEHVRLRLLDLSSGRVLQAKAWRMASEFPADIVDKTIKLAYTPRLDYYNGNINIDISIKDWKMWRL